jgi:hypothetical protein
MKQWWLVLATIAMFVVGDRIGAKVLEHVILLSPERYGQLYSGRLEGDILCAGNSRGVYMLDAETATKVSGKRIANISSNGLSAQVVKALTLDYLDHHSKPKTIVIEASCVLSPSGAGVVASFKPFWSHSPRLLGLGEKYAMSTVRATQVTRLYLFNTEFLLRSLFYLVENKSDQFGLLSGKIPQELIEEVQESKPFELQIVPEELQALSELTQNLRERGLEVRLVYAPYLPQYARKMVNLDASLQRIGDSAKLEVTDLTRALSKDDLFVDRVHMNADGARIVTKMLLDRGALK